MGPFFNCRVHPESLSHSLNKMTEPVPSNAPSPMPIGSQVAGRRRTRKGPSAKALKRVLKSHGLKSSGKKATLRARAKKAHLLSKA
jgi:hypothetical protein